MEDNSSDFGSIQRRLTFLMLGLIGIALALILRSASLQLLRNTRLETMAKRQFLSRTLIRPRRGIITDRNGEPLAVNIETQSLAANPSRIHNKREIAKLLSRVVRAPYAKLFQKLNEKREFVWIQRHLSEADLKRLKKWGIIDTEGDLIQGMWLVRESERVYPHGRLASQVLGGVNVDSEGLEGIELAMNSSLRGKVVSVAAIKDALGRPTFLDTVAAGQVQDGDPLTLTLDSSLQFEIERKLAAAVETTRAKSGSVIVMNAGNGEILALANEPGFNANDKHASLDLKRNRTVTDGYEPGSTFKSILLASALSHGWQLNDELWGERGSFTLQGHRISEAESHEKFGWVSLKKMLQVSSNVAAAKLALRVGKDRFQKTVKTFGFGSKTGIDFPGEISGRVPDKKKWSPLTLANIGFGQGILVTPIQMTRAYAAIINGGFLVHPKLVLRKPSTHEAEIPTRILPARVSRALTHALETVTQAGGTGTKAALPGYRVAGKTGTAQLVDAKTGRYSKARFIATFIGFPILSSDLKLVIFVGLNEPQGNYYASLTAAPLFQEVLESVVTRFSLPVPEPPRLSMHDQLSLAQAAPTRPFEKGTPTPPASKPVLMPYFSTKQMRWIIPPLKGLTPREALQVFQGHSFHLEVRGTGIISSHFPEPGKRVAEGDTIRLILSEP